MEYYLRFSSKTRQHKKRADCLHLSTKKPQPVVSGKISVFLGITEAIVDSFCLSSVFSNFCITLFDDCTHGSAKPRNHGTDVKIKRRMHSPPPPPSKNTLFFNFRTVRKCLEPAYGTLSEQQKKRKRTVFVTIGFIFFIFLFYCFRQDRLLIGFKACILLK